MLLIDSLIAQSVERRTVNPQVPGSSPGRGAKFSLFFYGQALYKAIVNSMAFFFVTVAPYPIV